MAAWHLEGRRAAASGVTMLPPSTVQRGLERLARRTVRKEFRRVYLRNDNPLEVLSKLRGASDDVPLMGQSSA